jgi:hypothetical protein
MVFWLMGANAPIIKNLIQMYFKMLQKLGKNLRCTSEQSRTLLPSSTAYLLARAAVYSNMHVCIN